MDWINGEWIPPSQSMEARQVEEKATCRFYRTLRGCRFGAQCRFAHIPMICERISVPRKSLGALIGKGGMTRHRIEAESGIEMMTILSSSCEVILTSYDRPSVDHALKLVKEIIDEFGIKKENETGKKKKNSICVFSK